ncbi:MAG TPA: maltose alpha-D-glucosyltransferase, partial [Thermoanaerobaculia bacterium]|nr:maltose alpha-D-glucosyltransferase [Thermoanaerobaculia bacterium]
HIAELGVNTIWLLPFYPSPRRDDGYDISEYRAVHPDYGTMADVKRFIAAAHARGIRGVTELVINHTSDAHAWFQRARRAKPGSAAREFYVWSDSDQTYSGTRIIFLDTERSNWTWDPVAGAYYWHRFYSHQPDLNFENERVHKAVLQALDFWMEMGVDGLRLDAIPYLFEAEGTNCENLPQTHEYLKKLRAHVDAHHRGRMLLAEANQWPEDAIAYFGDGDECHMAFHFPVMPRLYMAVRMEDRFPIIDILEQTPPIPESCQWAVFLRNHDELTLEMVTDEDRDYMYRVYAQDPRARINLGIRRRLAPLLGNDRRRIELMNGLLFSLPGSPVVYYGDEIGMGDNFYLGDRNGVRTPMQWSADRNAGFSRANPQKLYLPVIIDPEYHFEAVNVEAQQGNPHSLLWWMRRLIALRKRYRAFSRGTIEFLHPANHRVLAFIRRYDRERILVVANLSRFAQHAELDLSLFAGSTPVELFGRNRFPEIGGRPYPLTLGSHSFLWFALEPAAEGAGAGGGAGREAEAPVLAVGGSWTELLDGPARESFEAALPELLRGRRWFGGKARTVRHVDVVEAVPVGGEGDGAEAWIALVHVDYTEGEAETYALPLALERRRRPEPEAVLARVESREEGSGVLIDAVWDRAFGRRLLEAMARRRKLRGRELEIAAWTTAGFRDRGETIPPEPALLGVEQSNSSIRYGDRWVLKLFRRLEPGINPDLEIGRFLTEKAGFPHTSPVVGGLEVRPARGEPMTLGVLQGFVENEGDAWTYTLDALRRFYERALTRAGEPPAAVRAHLVDEVATDLPPEVYEVMGTYPATARLLGRRTAELHLALASETEDPAFAPEPFTALYQRSLYQSMRSLAGRTFQLLAQRADTLPEAEQQEAAALLGQREEVFARFQALIERKIDTVRIRTHGDYHLAQVLYTGKDFVIIDFEGEPARPLSERRLKRSPLRDVAGMLRSFHYAAEAALYQEAEVGLVPAGRRPGLESWAEAWVRWASIAFLQAYLATAASAPFLPGGRAELKLLLDVFVLEKAIYELAYELNNRPGWVAIPLHGIRRLLAAE